MIIFQNSLKELLLRQFNSADGSDQNLLEHAPAQWREFIESRQDPQCRYFQIGKDAETSFFLIDEKTRKARELVLENNLPQALVLGMEADQEVRKIKADGRLPDITQKLLALYPDIMAVQSAGSKEEAHEVLPDLKYKFTELRGERLGAGYDSLMLEMERAIADLDKLLWGPDYRNAQKRLGEVFGEIYFGF